jgi:hypothetical protein
MHFQPKHSDLEASLVQGLPPSDAISAILDSEVSPRLSKETLVVLQASYKQRSKEQRAEALVNLNERLKHQLRLWQQVFVLLRVVP